MAATSAPDPESGWRSPSRNEALAFRWTGSTWGTRTDACNCLPRQSRTWKAHWSAGRSWLAVFWIDQITANNQGRCSMQNSPPAVSICRTVRRCTDSSTKRRFLFADRRAGPAYWNRRIKSADRLIHNVPVACECSPGLLADRLSRSRTSSESVSDLADDRSRARQWQEISSNNPDFRTCHSTKLSPASQNKWDASASLRSESS